MGVLSSVAAGRRCLTCLCHKALQSLMLLKIPYPFKRSKTPPTPCSKSPLPTVSSTIGSIDTSAPTFLPKSMKAQILHAFKTPYTLTPLSVPHPTRKRLPPPCRCRRFLPHRRRLRQRPDVQRPPKRRLSRIHQHSSPPRPLRRSQQPSQSRHSSRFIRPRVPSCGSCW